MLDIVNSIQSNINQGLFSSGVFIDFKKASDIVDHNILLDKLSHYAFRGINKDWFSSYLNIGCPKSSSLYFISLYFSTIGLGKQIIETKFFFQSNSPFSYLL